MLGINGLLYVPNYISQPHHDHLLNTLGEQPWRGELARRTQHYGYVYDYRAKRLTLPLISARCQIGCNASPPSSSSTAS